MKSQFKEPELLCNDHHGTYMMKHTIEELLPKYRRQIRKQIGEENWEALKDIEHEFHFDACDAVTNCLLKTETGQQWHIDYAEGGLWAIPRCYMRTKEYRENWTI